MRKIFTLAALLCCLTFGHLTAQNVDYMGNPCDNCPVLPEVDNSNLRAGGFNTFTTLATYTAPTTSPNELAWDGTNLWLCAFGTNVIYRIDPNTGSTLGTIPTAVQYAAGLTYDGTNLWLGDNSNKTLQVVDPSNGNVIATYPHPTGNSRYVTGLAWDGTNVWNNVPTTGSSSSTDTMFYMTPATTVLNKWDAHGNYPTGAAYDGVNLWVTSNWPSPVIYKCDPATYAKLDSFVAPGGQYPNGLTWDGCHLWVCNNANNQIFKLQMPNAPSSPISSFSTSTSFLTATFTDGSSFANSYFWDFGDGNTSTTQNPSHTYAAPGTYTVCLTTTNSCGSDSTCGTVVITCPAPSASFSSTTSLLTASFTNTGSNGALSWDFGDGNSSTAANPSHTYAAPGTYTVCLIVSDSCGADTTCNSVTVTCPVPSANFSFAPNNLTVQFTTTGSGNHSWDFGDGNSSTAANPSHTYGAPGSYTVCHIISDSCGADTMCTTLIVTCPAPQASFTYSSNLLSVNFTDQSTGASSWAWDFGDGNQSSVQNPTYTYGAAGTYVACLTVSDSCGATTACDTIVLSDVAIDPAILEHVKLFPNPATDRLRVEFEGAFGLESLALELYDATGRLVLAKELEVDSDIAIGNLARGMYHYRLLVPEGMVKSGKLLLWNR